MPFIECDRQPAVASIAGSAVSFLPRPSQVARAGAVARLAADIDLCPGSVESIGIRVVVLPDARRVAVSAHEVPVLRRTRPMQFVVVRHTLGRVEMEPALAAVLLRAGIPGDR